MKAKKILLTLEVLVCFGPLVFIWLLGVILVPIQIAFLVSGDAPLDRLVSLFVIAWVVAATFGLFGLSIVLIHLYRGSQKIAAGNLVLVCIALGFVALVPMLGSYNGLLATAASIHILYLSRDFLFPSPRSLKLFLAAICCMTVIVLLLKTYAGGARSESELTEAQARWRDAAPNNYSYVIKVSGDVRALEPDRSVWSDLIWPKRIIVQEGKVVAVEYAGNFHPSDPRKTGDPAPIESTWTIDQVFDRLISNRENGAQIRATFDDTFGFLEEVRATSDISWRVEVTDFELIE